MDTIKLHTLNNLLSVISGSDPETAAHVRSAINFTLENATPGGPDEDDLLANAEHLVRMHRLKQNHPLPFHHCDFRRESYDPLWLRVHMRNALRELSGYPKALLLITGIRRMICPPGTNWTNKRQIEYNYIISYLEELAAEHSSHKTHLYLLFL